MIGHRNMNESLPDMTPNRTFLDVSVWSKTKWRKKSNKHLLNFNETGPPGIKNVHM